MLKKMGKFFTVLFGIGNLNQRQDNLHYNNKIIQQRPIDIFLNEINIEINNKSKFQSSEVQAYLDTLISEKKYIFLQKSLDSGAILSNKQFLTLSKDFAFFMNYGGSESDLFNKFSKEEHHNIGHANFKNFFNDEIIALTQIIFYKDYLDLVKSDYFIEKIKPQDVENPLFNNGFSYFICKTCTMKPLVSFNKNPILFDLITNMFLIEHGKDEKKLKHFFSLEIFTNLWFNSLDITGFTKSEKLQEYLNNQLEKWGYSDFKINLEPSRYDEDKKSIQIIKDFFKTINSSDYALSDSYLKNFFKNYPDYRLGTKTAVNINNINIISSDISSNIQLSFNSFIDICTFLKNSTSNTFHQTMLKKIEREQQNIQKSIIDLKTYNEKNNIWELPYIILQSVNKHIRILKSIRTSSDNPELINYSETTFLEIQRILSDLEQLNSIEKLNIKDTLTNLEPIFLSIQSNFKANNDLLLNSLEKNSKVAKKHLN